MTAPGSGSPSRRRHEAAADKFAQGMQPAADDAVMALVVTRRHGQSLRLIIPEGDVILVTLKPASDPSETKVVVEAPRSVVVQRPERD
jgi:sRNA-binding carbon storage regulator CsrA